MIKFGEPVFGWMEVTIGDMTFVCSYLTDVWDDLDYLLNLTEDGANKIFFDGESYGDVILTASLNNNRLLIVWEHNDETPITMTFDYEAFLECYKKEKERITTQKYIKDFIMEDRTRPSDIDNLLFDCTNLLKKYPDINYHLEVVNNKTGEHKIVD